MKYMKSIINLSLICLLTLSACGQSIDDPMAVIGEIDGACNGTSLEGDWQDAQGKAVAINGACQMYMIRCPMLAKLTIVDGSSLTADVDHTSSEGPTCLDYGSWNCTYSQATADDLTIDCPDGDAPIVLTRP